MAYAYSTLGRSGQRIGGTMDSVPGKELGPTAISKVTLRDDETRVVEDKTGSSGENDVQTEQVLDSAAADTSVDLLENVVSGEPERALRPATSRGARRERRTTTATRGSAAAPRTSPPACGSATRTATRR